MSIGFRSLQLQFWGVVAGVYVEFTARGMNQKPVAIEG